MELHLRCLLILLWTLLNSPPVIGQTSDDFLRNQFPGLTRQIQKDSLIGLSERLAEENPDSSLSLGNLALEIGIRDHDDQLIAHAERRIAEAWFYQDEYANAIDHYRLSAEAEYRIHQDSTFFFVDRVADEAYCYQELGLYDKSLELYRAIHPVMKKLGKKEDEGDNLTNIGTNLFFQGHYDQAVGYYGKALAIDRQRGDSGAIAVSLNNIGMVYSRWGKDLKALEFYTEALSFTPSEEKRSVRLSNIGMTWYHLKDYDKALDFLRQALAIDQKYNHAIKIGIRKTEIGNILAAKGQTREALILHEEALQVFREAGIVNSQIITLADMGDLYRKTGHPDKAESCFQEAARIAEQRHAPGQLRRIYKSLSELAETKGNFKTALEYHRLFVRVSDSLFSAEQHEQIARFEVLFQTEKKEKENQLLLRDNELKQKKQNLLAAAIGGLVLVLILIAFLYRGKAKNLRQNQQLRKQEQEIARMEIETKEAEKQILEDRVFAEKQINRLQQEKHLAEIEHKNTELANSTLCLVNKNEILGEIREKLRDKKNAEVQEVVQFIASNLDPDQGWHRFRVDFDRVHPGFFDRLATEYENLSDNDLRVSAYLRIGLSSKEIARLMHVSIEAINKSRQRLRKKLDLPPETDLSLHLKSI